MEDRLTDGLSLEGFTPSDSDKVSDRVGNGVGDNVGNKTGRFLYVSYEDDADEIILSSHSFIRKEFFDRERKRGNFVQKQFN